MTNANLNIKDVAELLRLAGKTAYSIPHRTELPAFNFCGQWRLRCADLDDWILAQHRPPTPPRRK